MPANTTFYLPVGDREWKKDDMTEVERDAGPPFQKHVRHEAAESSSSSSSSSRANLATVEDWLGFVSAKKYKEAKHLLRDNNWPPNHATRTRLWTEVCRQQAQEKQLEADNYYWDTVKQMSGRNCLWLAYKRKPMLPMDVEDLDSRLHLPSFVDPAHTKTTYCLNSAGVHLADRVICVVGYSYPAITFSPTIYAVACLLLHYMSEEDCYNSLCSLISWKQGKFIIQTKLMYDTSWRTVLHLTKKFAKVAYGNVNKYLRGGETCEHVFEGWLWWIFKYLPFAHLVRVMDCFLFEGSKVLYRVAMAILIIFQKHTGKADTTWAKEASANGIVATLAKFCQDIPVSPEKLLKVAFGIRALSQSEVTRILVHSEMYLKSRRNSILANNGETMHRSRSTEGIPTSQSQVSIQMASHTLTILEPNGQSDVARARSMGLCPFANFTSHVINPQNLLTLWSWLPARITMYQPQLLYTTDEHGCSLTTFYTRVEDYEPTVLVVKTTTNEIFGAYCSSAWAQRKSKDDSGQRHTYFGTGETFLFTIAPKMQKFAWVGIGGAAGLSHASELFMAGDSKMLTIGGGNGQGILIDEDVRYGRTETCQTFNNTPLSIKPDFECKVVEVFGFA